MNDELIQDLLNSPLEAKELLRMDFKTYFKVVYYYLYRQDFIFKPFYDIIFEKLQKIIFEPENTKHLMINIAPRMAKSTIIKLFISYCIAINKNYNFIYTSYSDELINNFSKDIKDIIMSDFYNKLFNINIELDSKAKSLWRIHDGGQLKASPMGGSITGFGSDLTIIDDALKAANYNSKTFKELCIDYYKNTLKTRFNDTKKGRFILIMQRLAVDDLSGWIQENEKDEWDIITIKSLENNKSIFEERLSTDFLLKLKAIDNYTFQAQYQQEPIKEGGNLIKTEWFKRYTEPPKYYENMFIVCDTAFSTKENADNSAFLLCGLSKGLLYILDCYAKRVDFINLKRDLKNFYLKAQENFKGNTISTIWIEKKASGQSLIQELLADNLPVRDILPTIKMNGKEIVADKYTRAQEVLTEIYDGYVYLPEQAIWISDFLNEVENFTGLGDTKDDRIDTLIYSIKIKKEFSQPDWKDLFNVLQKDNNIY